MSAIFRKKVWRIFAGAALLMSILAAGSVAWLNPQLTRYVESDRFRAELEKETAKGLHFPSGQYAPIRRTSFLTAESAEFVAEHGGKALSSMKARGITAKFNPLGVFSRRWQLDQVRIESGEVGIQTYAPVTEPSPSKPWFHVFLPERVYLKRVSSEPADVTWQLRGKKAGFFATRLLITPHGRDFEYQATGGTLKMPIAPEMELRQVHLLITKTLLTLHHVDLAPRGTSDGSIHGEGTAGTGDDRSVEFRANFAKLPIDEWVPASWKEHVSGAASGKIDWTGKNPKLEASSLQGSLEVRGGRVVRLPFLQRLAEITKKRSIAQLELSECSLGVAATYPKIEINNLALEDKGKFRIEGELTIREKALSGAIQLGVAREYLEWLPHPEEVFAREGGRYLWTTVHLSGTVDKPQQDLSPRVVEVLRESPGAFFELIFRQLGDALKNAFGGK